MTTDINGLFNRYRPSAEYDIVILLFRRLLRLLLLLVLNLNFFFFFFGANFTEVPIALIDDLQQFSN